MKAEEIVGHECRRCGKGIAEQKDPLCCECRYGPGAGRAYGNTRAQHDAYEHMTIIPIGYRLYWADDWFSSDWLAHAR